MNKKNCFVLLALAGLLPICSAQSLVYGTDARDSSGRPVRIIEQINEDGSQRKQVISPDFKGENFWPGYRGAGPNQYDYPDVSFQGNLIFTNTYNFFVIQPRGKSIYNLTRFIREKYQPRWSPDGQKIAFVTDLNNNCEIFVMKYDGTGMRNISWNRATHFSPSWSPDGKYIAFTSNRDGKFDLYVSDEQGVSQKKILSLSEDIHQPDWGWQNNRIAFSVVKADGSTEVMSVRPDGTDLKKHFSTPVWSGHVSWSVDGTKLAYSSQRSGNADIWIFDTKTNKHFNVTKTPNAQDYFPRWVRPSVSGILLQWKPDTQVISDEKLTMKGRVGDKPVLSMPVVIPPVKMERPRILFTAKDLPAIRARLSKAPYKTYWARFLKKCDGFLTDPKVDASLKKIAADPMRKRYAIPAFAELYYKELWLDAVMSLAFARQITGEEKYGKRAVEIMLKAAEEYRYAHGVMHSDYRMACAYDWVYDLIPKKDLKALNVLLKVSMDAKKDTCLNHHCGIYGSAPGGGNYAVYFAASLGPMGFAMMGEEGISDDYQLVAARLSLLALNKWIGEYGDAEEGFSYFHHPVGELTPFLVTLKKHHQSQALLDSNLKKIPGWMAVSAMKGGTETPAIDDADYLALRLPTGLLELYPEDQVLRKLWNSVPRKSSELTSVLGLLWWQPSEGKPQNWNGSLPDHGYFPHQGYAVLRAGDRMEDSVMAITAPQGSGHAHLTYGAISLTASGLRFLTDPGQAVPMSEYHSQILINGEGRNRSALSKPMLKKPVSDGNTVSVAVDFTEAFSVSFFGAPGYSGIPCGRTGIKKGKRIVSMMKAADGIPAYYLVYDKVEAGRKVKVEQLFTADQGMSVGAAATSRRHWIKITDGLFKGYYQSSEKADQAEWTVHVPKKGKWYLHLYARNGAPVSLEIDGKKYAVTYLQPYSRPDTWQWRHFRMKNKPFFVELDAGEHKIAIQSQAKIHAIALSERSDIYLGADAKTDLILEMADAKRIGKGWKWIKQDQTELHLIPMIGKPEIQVTRKIFNTRFHGQLQVALPQGIFSQEGETVEFLTFVYPAAPGMELPVVKDGKIHWKNAVDIIEIGKDSIKIRRTLK